MADPADRISQLKIDRSAAATAQPSWLLPGIVLAVAGIGILLWIFFRPGSAAVLVQTDVARRPPSVAAANSVLDASGYVVARRQATVSSKGRVNELRWRAQGTASVRTLWQVGQRRRRIGPSI